MTGSLEGVVVEKSRRHLRVDTPSGVFSCSLRGKLREHGSGRSTVVVGDRVRISSTGAGEGVLESVLPRRTELLRGTGGGRVNVVAANLDQLLVVIAAKDPPPRWSLVDRMLAYAHRDELEPGICLNKWDQVRDDAAAARALAEIFEIYRGLGYPVFRTVVRDGEGVGAIRDWLRDRATAVSGHSGVGKSTLLNALDPALDLRTARVSDVTGKGRHTTTAVSLLRMPFGGYVADTPGFRSFALTGMKRSDLGKYFPEFRPFRSRCRFSDCLCRGEPGCAVRAAVESGIITKFRYNNYLQILDSFEDEA